VDLNKDFIGAAKLREVAAAGPKRKLVGLVLEGKRIARQGTPVVFWLIVERLADETPVVVP